MRMKRSKSMPLSFSFIETYVISIINASLLCEE